VSDALDLSRLEAGHRALKLRTIAPSAFVADLLTTLGPEATRQGVVLASDVDAALGAVEGDPDLLKQLMLNLVGNALKFSPQGGRVVLRARAEGPEWRLEVEDAGVGIPEDQLDRVFERFYRVELKGGRRVPGTGLGLAIARHIVDLHDGVISAKNAPERGSIFAVRLPLRQLAPESVRAVTRSLGGRGDVKRLLATAVSMVSDVMGAEIVSVLLVDPETGDLKVAAARGLDESVGARRLPYRGSVAGAAMRAGQSLLVDNVETDRRIHKKSNPSFTKSLVCAPLVVAGETIGVLNVNNKVSREDFDEPDRALVATLTARPPMLEARACLPGCARGRRRRLRDARGARARAASCSRRAANWRATPSRSPAASSRARRGTRIALLAGPAATTRPAPSSRATRSTRPRPRRPRVSAARGERFDGTGWPHGLQGEAIPAGGRILAVLDAFETLTRGALIARTADRRRAGCIDGARAAARSILPSSPRCARRSRPPDGTHGRPRGMRGARSSRPGARCGSCATACATSS
jgi:putative methionine-R-sulfoxide reductase with GAF domain